MRRKNTTYWALYYNIMDTEPVLINTDESYVRKKQKEYQDSTGKLAWVKVGSLVGGKFRSL